MENMLINCAACGERVSLSAKACPKCGHPVTAAQRAQASQLLYSGRQRVAFLVLGLFSLFFSSCGMGNNDENKPAASSSSPQHFPNNRVVEPPPPQEKPIEVPKPKPPPLTNAQGREFDKKIMRFKNRWWDTWNDIKKTSIFDQLKEYEEEFFRTTTTVEDWSGEVSHMGKQDGGNDICLMIDLLGNAEDHVGVSQGCNGSFLSPDPNGIKKGTRVYQQLGEVVGERIGPCVLFS